MHEIEEEPETFYEPDDKEDQLSLDEGDRLFLYDVDSFLETNRTNYDYVKKYDPTYETRRIGMTSSHNIPPI